VSQLGSSKLLNGLLTIWVADQPVKSICLVMIYESLAVFPRAYVPRVVDFVLNLVMNAFRALQSKEIGAESDVVSILSRTFSQGEELCRWGCVYPSETQSILGMAEFSGCFLYIFRVLAVNQNLTTKEPFGLVSSYSIMEVESTLHIFLKECRCQP